MSEDARGSGAAPKIIKEPLMGLLSTYRCVTESGYARYDYPTCILCLS